MRLCAVDQGNRDAANELGIDLATDKLYPEALHAFQKCVAAGDMLSAYALQYGFDTVPSDKLYYIGLSKDPERSRRYGMIWKFLDDHDGLNPKVPDIDQIVPLPPVDLPAWDGTFQWQREQDAAKPPQKPDEKQVERLAREKGLDPATGLPLKQKNAQGNRVPLGTVVRADEVCPETGVWCAKDWQGYATEATRRISKSEIMPRLTINHPRPVRLLDAFLGMCVERINAPGRDSHLVPGSRSPATLS